MEFTLTDEQAALREEAETVARERIEPVARDLDRRGDHPTDVLAHLGERRLTGLTIGTEYGGRGAGMVDLALVVEALSGALMPVASAVALHLGVAEVLERFGSPDQRERVLPEMATFDTVGVLGLSEADAGSDKLAMETTAERDGDEWVLNGHKQWVTNALESDVVLTYAKTGPEAAAPHNVSAFLVPTEAVSVERVWETLGARTVPSPRVSFEDVRVPASSLVGEEGEAYVQRGQLQTGINVPARGVGIAQAALSEAVAYVEEREQFDQPIADFQGVGWTLGELATRVDTARLLTLRAADRADRGLDTTRAFSMAKVAATQAAVDTANDALQLHGGMGYTTEHHVERHLRDARLLTIAGGPNEGHRDTLAAAVRRDGGRIDGI